MIELLPDYDYKVVYDGVEITTPDAEFYGSYYSSLEFGDITGACDGTRASCGPGEANFGLKNQT